jgi:beta-glucosidase
MAAQAMGALGGDQQEGSSAASEAVSDEMTEAMMKYMPLRSLISFAGGKLNHEMLQGLLAQMND